MRTLFGIILGSLLTIAVFYVHDSMVASTGGSPETSSMSKTIVNWDVAASDWGLLKELARTTWLKLTAGING